MIPNVKSILALLAAAFAAGNSYSGTVEVNKCRPDNVECHDPIVDSCRIDMNTTAHLEQKVLGLTEGVRKATLRHLLAHSDAVKKYELPGDFFWDAVGLSKVFSQPKACCGACNKQCLPDIVFEKSSNLSNQAAFHWDVAADGVPLIRSSDPAIPNIKVDITFEGPVTGVAVLWADGAEYFFYNPRPKLALQSFDSSTQKWILWFDGELSCFAPASDVTILNAKNGVDIPYLPMKLVQGEPPSIPPVPLPAPSP